jgi:uncharacterized protein (TIGR02246 family)
MKRTILSAICAATVLLVSSCNNEAKQTTPQAVATTETAKPDLAQIRTEIQAIENEWAAAQNAKDINKLMALYADDAVSMPDGAPTLSGKAAIRAQQEKDFAGAPTYASIAFETQDVYGDGNVVTEVGKTIYKDANGKAIRNGKYMAVFEKRNGKYLCIREIYNKDFK